METQPVTDALGWADAARDASGALSAWARFDSANADELRAAAAAIAQTAQQRRAGGQLGRRVKASPMGTAFILLAAAKGDKATLMGAVFMAQLLKTAEAIRDYHHQSGNLRQAHLVHHEVVSRLQAIKLPGYAPDPATLTPTAREALAAQQLARTGQSRPAGSPLPRPLDAAPRTGARHTNRGQDTNWRGTQPCRTMMIRWRI